MLSKNFNQRKKKKNLKRLVEQEWPYWRPIVYGMATINMDIADDLEVECANIALDIKNDLEREARKRAKRKARNK